MGRVRVNRVRAPQAAALSEGCDAMIFLGHSASGLCPGAVFFALGRLTGALGFPQKLLRLVGQAAPRHFIQ